MAHEMLMVEQAKKSQTFAGELAKLPMFPMFYVEPVLPPMPAMAPEAPVMAPGLSQGLPMEQELPVNPMVGGEAQLPTLEPQPNLEAQLGQGPVPPVEPTRGA
jgi:hypothetical protein